MNVLADEGIDRPIVDGLRQAGQDVVYVAELTPGLSDDVILDQANHDNAILVTSDNDFGELIFSTKPHSFRRGACPPVGPFGSS